MSLQPTVLETNYSRVVIVDDDAQISQMLEKFIVKWGYRAEVAGTGKEALERIRNKVFDLVLLDIVLPDIHGRDLIPQLKRAWAGIRIVTMTGFNNKMLETEIRRLGIVYYLTKPVRSGELQSILAHMSERIAIAGGSY